MVSNEQFASTLPGNGGPNAVRVGELEHSIQYWPNPTTWPVPAAARSACQSARVPTGFAAFKSKYRCPRAGGWCRPLDIGCGTTSTPEIQALWGSKSEGSNTISSTIA